MENHTKASDFTLFDSDNNEISLKQFKGKWIILYFYPKDNTSGCTKEAIDFSKIAAKFTKENAIILGVSPDSVKSHSSFKTKQDLKIILLSDPNHIVAQLYGVWQKKKLYGKEYMGIVRTTFLIDPNSKICQTWNKVKVDEHAEIVYTSLCQIKNRESL